MTSEVLFHDQVDDLVFHAVVSDRQHGDLHPIRTDPHLLGRRQHAVAGRRWSMTDQRHGRDVVEVDERSSWPLAGVGDVVVSRTGAAVGVWAADCAPLLLFGTGGTVAAVHAGWRGLAAGVIDAGVAAVVAHGERVARVVLGPVIHACCYEFGAADLQAVALGVHADPADISAGTSWGSPALDVPAAVRAACAAHQLDVAEVGPCTGCDADTFSHRRRQQPERHALVGWVERREAAGV